MVWEQGALSPNSCSHNLCDLEQVIVPSELRVLTLETQRLAGIIPGCVMGFDDISILPKGYNDTFWGENHIPFLRRTQNQFCKSIFKAIRRMDLQ